MLAAEQINTILDVFYHEIEDRLPQWKPITLASPESVPRGTFGSFIFGALFSGTYQGKMTLILDWDTAARLAGDLQKNSTETLDESARAALDELFMSFMKSVSLRFIEEGASVEISPLPIISDACVLLSEDREMPVLKCPLETRAGIIQLFLAFK